MEDLPDVSGRSVLVRVDFNVPLKDGQITDDLRIRAALPTLTWLTERGARVTTCTHLGRPKGEPNPKFSVDPVRARLAELAPGVELLENLRFNPGEEANDPAFVECARALGAQMQHAPGDARSKLSYGFERCTARPPILPPRSPRNSKN